MTKLFNEIFHEVIGNEGGYSNHPNDPGGETMWGVTERVARRYSYRDEMKDLPLSLAKHIYKDGYWDDYFEGFHFIVSFNVFDAAINHGRKQAIKFLQRAVGVADDGYMGPNTFAAAVCMDPYKVACLFNAERLEFYCNLRTFRTFGKGWTRRVANNLRK